MKTEFVYSSIPGDSIDTKFDVFVQRALLLSLKEKGLITLHQYTECLRRLKCVL